MSVQARPQDYAAAIYDLAFETWTRQLSDVQTAVKKDSSLHAVLGDPKQTTQAKLAFLA